MNIKKHNNVSVLLCALLAIVPLIIIPFYLDYYYLPKIIAVYLFVLIMFVVHVLDKNRYQIKSDNISIVLIVYWFTLIISTFFSIDIMTSLRGKILREEGLIAILAYGFLFLLSKTYYKHSDIFLKIIIISSVIVALYGVCQYFGFDPIPRDVIRRYWTKRAFSTIGNPNFLGSYVVLLLPISAFYFLKKGAAFSLLASSVIYLCLLLTFTRSAYLGFCVIFVFITVYTIRKKTIWKSYILLVVVFILLTLFVIIISNGYLVTRFTSIASEGKTFIEKNEGYINTGANRGYIWIRTIELIKNRPLVGYGLENLGTVFIDTYGSEIIENFGKLKEYDKAHNEYLHIAVSAGIPSLIAYLAFIGLCLLKALKNLKINMEYMPYLAAVSAYLVQAFFNISVVSVAYIFWIFLGAIVNDGIFSKDPKDCIKTQS